MKHLELLVSVAACGTPAATPADASPDAGADAASDAAIPHGNPLGVDDSVFPFPSAYYEATDTTTATGVRVSFAASDLPAGDHVPAIDPAPWNAFDGFSPAAPMLVWLGTRLDAASLPPETDPAQSLAPGSPTVIVDMESGERVPHFAELDATATGDEPQLLIIRPMQRLKTAHRYAAAVTISIRAAGGAPVGPTPGMRAILDGDPARVPGLDRVAPRYGDILRALDGAGAMRADLVVAWDFVTDSEDVLTRDLAAMRRQALAAIGEHAESASFTITHNDPADADHADTTLRVLHGTYASPLFLERQGARDFGRMVRGADGLPAQQGTYAARFTMLIPAVAATRRPLPLLVYGHGLLGDSDEALAGWLRDFANTYGYVVVAHEWRGLSTTDLPQVVRALTDPNQMPALFERLEQGIVDPIVLTRVARWRMSQDDATKVDGDPIIDTTQVYYHGNSQGGIFGGAFMAWSPDIERGALGVGAGNYSLLLQRSVDWPQYGTLMRSTYPSARDGLLLISLMQQLWDRTDAIDTTGHLLADSYADTPAKRILMQAGVGDSQVPTIGEDILARTTGIALLGPDPVHVPYGLTPADGPLDSALVYYDYGATPRLGNGVTDTDVDNGVHELVRRTPAAQRQMAAFLSPGGRITNTCAGPCVCRAHPGDDGYLPACQ